MPLYTYTDKKTNKSVDVLRSFADYEKPPLREELPNMDNEEFNAAEWVRDINGGQVVVRASNWAGKGNW